jgi:TonB family protein
MKKNLIVLMLAIALLVVQACGPKPEEKKADLAIVPPPPVKAVALTASEKKAKVEKQRAEWLEKRRIKFEEQAKATPTFKDADGNIVYYKTEVSPVYPGGDEAMMDYLRGNVKYPTVAQEKAIEGTVFVDFIITRFGNVREVQVTDTTNEDVDQSFRDEAVRVVTSMPKWQPGRQNGKTVAVKFSIPITFEMI